MPAATPQAGDYVLTADVLRVYTGNDFVEYVKGDLITLTQADAVRLLNDAKPAVEKPGESQQREMDQLAARMSELTAQQDALDAQKAEASKAKASAAKPNDGQAPPAAAKPTGK